METVITRKEVGRLQKRLNIMGKSLQKLESDKDKTSQDNSYYASLWTELFSINSKLTDIDRSLSYAEYFQNRHKCGRSQTNR